MAFFSFSFPLLAFSCWEDFLKYLVAKTSTLSNIGASVTIFFMIEMSLQYSAASGSNSSDKMSNFLDSFAFSSLSEELAEDEI